MSQQSAQDLTNLFNPKSIAVVGASLDLKKVGNIALRNILESGFKGKVWCVNPKYNDIAGVACFASVVDLPQVPDLVAVAVPAANVLQVVQDCATKGVKNLVIYSAGFKEIGKEGAELEKQLLVMLAAHDINMLGPNCFGFLNNSVPLNITFGQGTKLSDGINFISQSGAIAASLFDYSKHIGLGFNEFITLGNKTLVNENSILEYWLDKKETKPIGMYIESIADGIKFLDLVKKFTLHSPIFVLKPGKSEEAKHAMQSHTGSLAGEDFILDKAFQNSGIIRCYGLEDLFDLTKALSWENFTNNPKVAVVSNAGGPAVMSADIVSEYGLTLATIGTETKKYLSEHLPRSASLYNPIDLLGDALADRYETAITEVLKQDDIGSIVVLLTPQVMTEVELTAEKISKLAAKHKKTIVCSFIGGGDTSKGEEILNKYKIPCYPYPERAIRTLGLIYKWKKWQKDYANEKGISVHDLKSEVKINIARQPHRAMAPDEVDTILKNLNIQVPESYLAKTEEDVPIAARKLGFPLVAKISMSGIVHKTQGGGVSLDITSERQLLAEFKRLKAMDEGANVFIQQQVQSGTELILGVKRDPTFGYFTLLGAGGIHAEILKDRNIALFLDSYPSMLKSIGLTSVYKVAENKKGILDVVDALIGLVNANPIFLDIEINPLIVTKDKVWAVDGKATLL